MVNKLAIIREIFKGDHNAAAAGGLKVKSEPTQKFGAHDFE